MFIRQAEGRGERQGSGGGGRAVQRSDDISPPPLSPALYQATQDGELTLPMPGLLSLPSPLPTPFPPCTPQATG